MRLVMVITSTLQEVDSIFRNIRSVERYLGEVGGAVAVCREGGAAKKEGEEEVDYEGDSESEDHMGNGTCRAL